MSFTTRPELTGTFGMVASTHWLATAAGMAALEAGGNAFDAAVATALTLQVVEPDQNGPGGDVPILLWSRDRGEPLVVCGQGPAPAAATIGHFRALGLDVIPGTGLLAPCVPGAFDAWLLLLLDFGTLRLADVAAHAIHHAERGFPVSPTMAEAICGVAGLFAAEWPSSAELWLQRGAGPRPGAMVTNRTLAETLRRIVREAEAAGADREGQIQRARDVFLRGFVAEAIDAHVRRPVLDSSGGRHAGLLSGDDLAGFAATLEPVLARDHAGHTICKTGPWGQGPVMHAQLALLEGYDLAAMGRDSAAFVHTVVECAKLAFADREAWYGDPAFTDVDMDGLLDPARTAARRALVEERASMELRPGALAGREPHLPSFPGGAAAAAGTGEPSRGDTCHLDTADRHGNLVSASPSGGWLQSSPAIPGLGFPLGTRAQMLWLEEGHPNALAPGKRPRTTLSPTLVLREGEGYLALGTPGGDQQDQWSLLMLLSHLHFGMDLQAAIDAPAFDTTHFPSSFDPHESVPGEVEIEGRFSPGTLAGLEARDHRVRVGDPWSLGQLSGVRRDSDGVLHAGANPRGMQGYAAGR
jgi:gamma-glutamyltranspeptidase / glutathione hydrolase